MVKEGVHSVFKSSHLYDVLHKTDDNSYRGMFGEHVVDNEGWIDGYEIMSGPPIIYVFEFNGEYNYGKDYGYVTQESDGKFYLDIENCGYVKDTLQECYDLLYDYYSN